LLIARLRHKSERCISRVRKIEVVPTATPFSCFKRLFGESSIPNRVFVSFAAGRARRTRSTEVTLRYDVRPTVPERHTGSGTQSGWRRTWSRLSENRTSRNRTERRATACCNPEAGRDRTRGDLTAPDDDRREIPRTSDGFFRHRVRRRGRIMQIRVTGRLCSVSVF